MAKLKLHQELFDYDKELRRSYPILCGVDEAGRGPLAGDVYAAAVVLSDEVLIEGLNDSKKISEKNRELLYDVIIEKADDYCIASASVEEIDSINILQAAMLAMKRAVSGLKKVPDLALIDGNRLPELNCPAEFLIKGDARSASIAPHQYLQRWQETDICVIWQKNIRSTASASIRDTAQSCIMKCWKNTAFRRYTARSFLKKVLK